MRGDRYQIALIASGVAVTLLMGVFFARELFPEYKIYQNRYYELEEFRSSYTQEPMAPFRFGIKQIVLENKTGGPVTIDRCTSCHLALDLEHFSPTHLVDGKEEQNPNYVWGRLEQTIEKLRRDGDTAEADRLEGWKTVTVGEETYDMAKVLRMHPLMANETRPFEFHPIEEYGCVSCHNGNGLALTTPKAHGPIYDGSYEKENIGPVPLFTEPDPKNDPPFSKIFNGKPGHPLLFQTTPLFVGNTIQAKCIQCHNRTEHPSAINQATETFHQGEILYFSQACYACHRIAGTARGGVGPDLTNIGNFYPWFIKESIVWPQADLKTSTMPNYHLDHGELEGLVTYLLAQKGRPLKESEMEYKVAVAEWEAGKKTEIEQPIPPRKERDFHYGMTLFATEGCAACHRLKGYESNVGFAVEKEKPDFETLFREREWFQRLIPEEIIGSEIVTVLENHADEIDRRIVEGVREGSLLEEIHEKFPGILESFNSSFEYAIRAKNHLMMPVEEQKLWKRRIDRLHMMYIQEYGLGRLVGPRPNWSGIFRTNEWLMGHFWKPSAYHARSIMPVFPFDNSKFYALTEMLNSVAIKNRNAVHEIWKHRGFDPELATEIFCSQCHGPNLQGNGPVAEWIYPIPKNLRNATFLRKLTKENVRASLKHGIKGTPMPPWGEVAEDKPTLDGIPVMTEDQIRQMTDWLFASLSGAGMIREELDVPKWHYGTEDVMDVMKKEGNRLQTNPKDPSVFRKVEGADGEEMYLIQEKYYTNANFQAGKSFFEVNCAVCHGKELDGAGFRAGTMFDAKPRMLANLKWLRSRDDLRLLRSIKYGVDGTSMIPWGDQTSALQRLQLVIFIRMTSQVQNMREDLFRSLYQTYDEQFVPLEDALYVVDIKKQALEEQKGATQQAHEALYAEVRKGEMPPEEALTLYQQELKLDVEIQEQDTLSKLLLQVKEGIQKERDLLQHLGVFLINRNDETELFPLFLDLISQKVATYVYDNGKLLLQIDPVKEVNQRLLANKIEANLAEQVAALKTKKLETSGKISSPERKEEMEALDKNIEGLEKLQKNFNEALKESLKLRREQKRLVDRFNTEITL